MLDTFLSSSFSTQTCQIHSYQVLLVPRHARYILIKFFQHLDLPQMRHTFLSSLVMLDTFLSSSFITQTCQIHYYQVILAHRHVAFPLSSLPHVDMLEACFLEFYSAQTCQMDSFKFFQRLHMLDAFLSSFLYHLDILDTFSTQTCQMHSYQVLLAPSHVGCIIIKLSLAPRHARCILVKLSLAPRHARCFQIKFSQSLDMLSKLSSSLCQN